MARSIVNTTHPNGSVISLTSGQMPVTIYTSSNIVVAANSGIMLNITGTISDTAPGYVLGTMSIIDLVSAVSYTATPVYSYGLTSISSTLSFQNMSSNPITVNVVIQAAAQFANTTSQITSFKTESIQLFSKEKVGRITISDNNVSYPGYGTIITGTSGTNWINVLTQNIPAGNMVTFIGLPFNSVKESGTTPIFEYQVLKNGVVVDTFDFNPDYNQTGQQLGIRYSVETTEATTILIQVRCKSAGGAATINGHGSAIVLSFDLDNVGKVAKHIVDSYTPVSANPMLKTSPLNSAPGNKILKIICTNLAANDFFYRNVSYRNTDFFENAVGSLTYPDALTENDISTGASLSFQPGQSSAVSNPRGDFHYGLFEQPSDAINPAIVYNYNAARDQRLRPGSAIYLLDLTAEVTPPIEYDPVSYLEVS